MTRHSWAIRPCPNCCDASEGNNAAGNGTIRSEKWDFGAATYIGPGPDPTNWIEWAGDCSSGQSHLLTFPGPGEYTVTMFTQNHCGIDTVTREIMVAPPPSVEASAAWSPPFARESPSNSTRYPGVRTLR